MAERFNDVDVEIRISGNELPELLTTLLQVIALIGNTALRTSVRLLLRTNTVVDRVLDSLKPIDLIADGISDRSNFILC